MMKKIPSGVPKALSEVFDCSTTTGRRKIAPIFHYNLMSCDSMKIWLQGLELGCWEVLTERHSTI